MAVYGYVRVSTQGQIDGESLGQQQRAIEGYCMMHGVSVDAFYIEEGVKGTTPLSERPKGSELLSAVKSGDMVVGYKLDRMFRSALDSLGVLEMLKKQGVTLHLIDLGGDVTGNGVSKLVYTILSAVAEAERERIRERVADVKRDQKDRNMFLGGNVPFGFRIGDEGQLLEDEKQQAAIKRMRALACEGRGTREIASIITADGCEVSHMTVARILKRAAA
jgi:putative DNA-invertase from lambdoid prophage Rac